MTIASLNQISTPMLLGIVFAILVLNTIFLKWFLGKIQSEPVDELEEDDAVEAPDVLAAEPAVRTSAGVPRARPIQPVEPPGAGSPGANPIRLTSLAETEAVAAPPAIVSPAPEPEAPAPAPAPETASTPVAPALLTKMPSPVGAPTASLTMLPADKPAAAESPRLEAPQSEPPAPPRGPASSSPLFGAPEQSAPSADASSLLPPLNFSRRAPTPDRPGAAPILEPGRTASADLIMTPSAPAAALILPVLPAASAKPPVPLASTPGVPAADLIFVDKPTPALSSMTPDPKAKSVAATEGSEGSAKDMPTPKTPESIKPAGADLIAIPPVASVSEKPVAASDKPVAGSDKAAAAEPGGGGLILIPSSPEASPVAPEADKPALGPGVGAPGSWKTRLLGRPRIFLPTAGSSAAPEGSTNEEAAETVVETSLKSEFADLKGEAKLAEAKTAPPVSEPIPAAEKAPEPAAAPVAEAPAMLMPMGETKPEAKLGVIADSEILVPGGKTEPPAPAPAKPEEPAKKLPAASEPAPPPAVDLAPIPEITAAPEPAAAPRPVEVPEAAKPVELPKAVEAAKPVEPARAASPGADLVPLTSPAAIPAASAVAGSPPEKAVPAPNPPAPTRPVMNQKESTAVLPSGGRASAQITLGFEITSLQLTPFFKLGAVQLRSLSNVVSLHLIASQAAENPLAAGISFQIETVDLDEASHIKSILLKPLGQSTPTATPSPKLQVENVKLGTGNEGAIEITSSQQTSTAVQMLATFTIAAMDFTPSFEIGSLRLEPNSNTVMLRLAPSSKPTALDLPPSFEVATVSLEGSAQLATVRLVPSGAK